MKFAHSLFVKMRQRQETVAKQSQRNKCVVRACMPERKENRDTCCEMASAAGRQVCLVVKFANYGLAISCAHDFLMIILYEVIVVMFGKRLCNYVYIIKRDADYGTNGLFYF